MSDEKTTVNVPVDAETNRILEELQEEWYGTSKKKGLVLDRIVQSYNPDGSMESQVDDIHSWVAEMMGVPENTTHTVNPPADASPSQSESWSEETIELADHLEQDDVEVNPDNWSQEALEAASGRGASPYDADDLITGILRFWETSDRDSVEQAYKIAGYGRSTIGRYAREYIKYETNQIVDEDDLLNAVVETGIQQNDHRARYTIGENSKDSEATARRKYEEEFGSSIKDNLGVSLEIGSNNLIDKPVRTEVQEDVGKIVTVVSTYDFAGYQTATRVLRAYDDAGLLDDDLREYVQSNWRENHEAPV
ncbi:hypothetical protein N0B31_18675 [Salinirubellus salinus]|uniref:Uncharacterized protein n=1 Tax=Salinirubellus salinus TaxID=1364945 RepID=A0A9E7R3J0_9EURY|nr:hypothetical protein [Salinirubellus salinus]UWM54128.1 hypothetical protein N0B31_18675 [Salinirubellus salinus]